MPDLVATGKFVLTEGSRRHPIPSFLPRDRPKEESSEQDQKPPNTEEPPLNSRLVSLAAAAQDDGHTFVYYGSPTGLTRRKMYESHVWPTRSLKLTVPLLAKMLLAVSVQRPSASPGRRT